MVNIKKNKFVVPDGKTLLIVGQDKDTINAYTESLKIVPAGFTVYTSVQQLDGLYQSADHGGGVHHFQYLIRHYPNTVIQVGFYIVDALDDIPKGAYDANIDELGKWIKSAARPVYLRIGYEFDYPQNNYQPKAYVRAFRYIVDRFRGCGIDNVAYVWHSYAAALERPVMDWYPGDEYVDWFAVSYFIQTHEYMNAMYELSRRHKKPFMIAEATPQGIGTLLGKESWDKWFKVFFDFIEERDVKVACYINCDWERLVMFKGQGWGDARVQANSFVEKKWLEEIKKPRYISSSDSLYKMLGYSVP